MNDRELLELAAKACGIYVEFDSEYEGGDDWTCYRGNDFVTKWNPLADDGDALRLAVRLGVLVDVRYTAPEAIRYNRVTYWPTPSRGVGIEFGDRESDPLAATRRAIVRAAAEIGKASTANGEGA